MKIWARRYQILVWREYLNKMNHKQTPTELQEHMVMPPEYIMVGNYSEKTDVFSFGVLLVEIVCGKKNNASYREDCTMNLIGHAWELWTENRGCELIDETLEYSLYDKRQAMRCIHVGLLCTQEQPAERPSMSAL